MRALHLRGTNRNLALFCLLALFWAAPEALRAAPRPLEAQLLPGRAVEVDPPVGREWSLHALRTRAIAAPLPDFRDSETVRLNLFDDLALRAVLRRLEVRGPGDHSWIGTVEGEPLSSVILVEKAGTFAGIVQVPGITWNIHSEDHGILVVEEVLRSDLPSCGGEVVVPEEELFGEGFNPAPALAGEGTSGTEGLPGQDLPPILQESEDGTIIDVLIVWTPSASSTEAQAQAVIDDVNVAYENSGVEHRVRLVGTGMVSYSESGNGGTDLDRLRRRSDGFLDEVHQMRDDHCADLVSLWVRNAEGICGIAYLNLVNDASFQVLSFSVIVKSCLTNDTVAHELGHNMGAAHDRQNSDRGLFSYSFGYQHPQGNFRTIMAYPDHCVGLCPRVKYFSNPDVSIFGQPTGVPLGDPREAHNTLTLNQTAAGISAFRDWDLCANKVCFEDANEPDDNCFNSPLMNGVGARTYEQCTNPYDWVRFGGVAGNSYVIETSDLGVNGDTILTLMDDTCFGFIAQDDDSGAGTASRLEFTPTESKCYAVRISQPDGEYGVGRQYTLNISGDTDPVLCCPISPPEDFRLSLDRSAVPAEVTLSWTGETGQEYNVYRGPVNGPTFQYSHSCHVANLPAVSYMEQTGDGTVRDLAYYLVTTTADCGETTFGLDSQGGDRPSLDPCPR